jgi:glycosyltransferase involved in cell wall biosynthesis
VSKKILYIGNALSAKGNTVTVMETLSEHLKAEGFKVYTASSIKNKVFRFLDMLRAFYTYREEVNAILIDTYSTQNFYFAYFIGMLAKKHGVPYYPILHGGNLPARLKKNPKRTKQFFGNAALNISPSQYLMEAFTAEGYHNLKYIPNTINIDEYPFQERKNVAPTLLWVRSFSNIYNPMLALKIVEALLKKGMGATLTMVGPEKDGSLAKCKQYAKQKNLPVTFTGKLSKKQWIELSKQSDIFINTTNVDNMPVSVVEAMALGLPVISTNVGGIPYLIDAGKNGILVPKQEVLPFVLAIEDLMLAAERTQNISKKAHSFAKKFDWESVKLAWFEILK